jgi:lysophospholipase L1-like esterase
MLGKNGRPRPELFLEDGLHLDAAGYDLWRDVVGRALARERKAESED